MKLLHIDSSPLGTASVSRELSAAVVASTKARIRDLDIVYRDLAAAPLSHWTPTEATCDTTTVDEFLSADVVVIGAPMYNFGVPTQLKAWIDRILVAGKTFRYGANGAEGLAGGRKIIVTSSRGGVYSAGSGLEGIDFQETYLRHVFGFIGVTDVEFVRAEGVNLGADVREKSIHDAHATIGGRLAIAA
jgi:FMN-dependent NADH-azoreductase